MSVAVSVQCPVSVQPSRSDQSLPSRCSLTLALTCVLLSLSLTATIIIRISSNFAFDQQQQLEDKHLHRRLVLAIISLFFA